MTIYRPEFEAALRLFAGVSEGLKARGFLPLVLVGAAAVELYSSSAGHGRLLYCQDEFEAELRAHGFTKPEGLGHTPLGWTHPRLRLGFEVVAATLFDGVADRDRRVFIDLTRPGRLRSSRSKILSPTGWASRRPARHRKC